MQWRRFLILCSVLFATGAYAQTQNDPRRFGATGAEWSQMLATHDAEIKRVAQRLGLREETLREIARELGIRNPKMSAEQFVTQIRKRAADAVKLRETVTKLEAEIADLKNQDLRTKSDRIVDAFFAAFEEGRLDDAEKHLADLRALHEANVAQSQLKLREVIVAQGQLAVSRGDFDKGAATYRAAQEQAEMATAQSEYDQLVYATQEGLALAQKGDALGSAEAYREALSAYQNRALPKADRVKYPTQWAATLISMAMMKGVLLTYEPGAVSAQAVIDDIDKALSVLTTNDPSLLWGLAHRTKADALQIVGTRATGTDLLLQAVEAYKIANDTINPESEFGIWGETQSRIGNLYLQIGFREQNSGYLQKGLGAYDAALAFWNKDKNPIEWAEAKIGSANVQWVMGQLDPQLANIEASYTNAREGIAALSEDSAPVLWAEGNHIAGMASLMAAERRVDTLYAQRAVSFFMKALRHRKKEENAPKWAETMNGIGMAASFTAQRSNADEDFGAAEDAFNQVLTVWTPQDFPMYHAQTASALAMLYVVYGKSRKQAAPIKMALKIYDEVELIWSNDVFPEGWAMNQNAIGAANSALGDIEKQSKYYSKAIAAFERSQSVLTREASLKEWLRAEIGKHAALAFQKLAAGERGAVEPLLSALDRLREEAEQRELMAIASFAQRAKGDVMAALENGKSARAR